jgi:hypothetical protein
VIEAATPADAPFEVGGMRLAPAAGDYGPLLVLSLEDPTLADLFATVCADALRAASTTSATEVLVSFLARLHAWRRFLRERRSGLTRNETIGLMGELVVLQHLMDTNPQHLSCWVAPNDGLHDFELAGHALEVKATIGPAANLRISSLDQLDVSGLRRLDLLHVRMAEAPEGLCLDNIIQKIAGRLPDDAARRAFDNALLRRGLMPDDASARTEPRTIVQALIGFMVGEAFPRLVRRSVPSGVIEAEYRLELRAIEPYAVDADTVLAGFARGWSGG